MTDLGTHKLFCIDRGDGISNCGNRRGTTFEFADRPEDVHAPDKICLSCLKTATEPPYLQVVGQLYEDDSRLGGASILLCDLTPENARCITLFPDLLAMLKAQVETCNSSHLYGLACNKPATWVEYGYEGEEDWRCDRHVGRPSNVYPGDKSSFKADESQQAIQALIAKAEAAL